MPRAKVTCPTDGDVIADVGALVIDDAEGCYRFTCPRCGSGVTKRMDDAIRDILRSANVATLEELVISGASELADDESIWRGVLQD